MGLKINKFIHRSELHQDWLTGCISVRWSFHGVYVSHIILVILSKWRFPIPIHQLSTNGGTWHVHNVTSHSAVNPGGEKNWTVFLLPLHRGWLHRHFHLPAPWALRIPVWGEPLVCQIQPRKVAVAWVERGRNAHQNHLLSCHHQEPSALHTSQWSWTVIRRVLLGRTILSASMIVWSRCATIITVTSGRNCSRNVFCITMSVL